MVENLKHLLISLNNNKSIMWVCAQSHPALCYPIYCSLQGSSVHEILRQEYWHGLPLPTPGDLPNPEIEPMSLASSTWAGGFFATSSTWEAQS